jgi:hypothetical protein
MDTDKNTNNAVSNEIDLCITVPPLHLDRMLIRSPEFVHARLEQPFSVFAGSAAGRRRGSAAARSAPGLQFSLVKTAVWTCLTSGS